MLSHFIARRYLFSPHSRSVVNLISGLSVAAVAVPVAAMVILLSVFNGFETLVKSMYSAFDADLTLTPRRGQTFVQTELDTADLRRIPGVAALSCTLEQSVLLEHAERQATATVRGVDDSYGEVFDLEDAVTTGEWRVRLGDLERLVIGQSMAWMLGIRTLADADVTLYAVRRGSFSTLLPMDNYTRRTEPVGGVYVLDLDTERTYVLSSLRLAQSLFEAEGRVSGVVFRLTPDADVERTREAVSAAAGDSFRVRTRDELRASFYRIMTYEKWGIFFIALLVLVIASFSVVGALSMLIVEKRRDIATLRALGADTPLLRRIFRTEGMLICGLGAVIGLLLGVSLSLVQQHFGVIEIPAESFLTKSYPVEFRLSDLFAVAVSFALVAALLADITVRSMIKNTTRS
ncbi:MAG TPA: FtsX-like permease family protein [Candidatus Alistipes intestinigallinarum]|uniref:FtsX-like permease family protein n=1 Tax=Candidatus Alistipes intestinigallinarum TaxID=2838440 RepID=A0A9D2CB90_9BACT|nr:FtsX-like permease family protein [Candidatus Alistipes intestinigallinarum]